MKVLLVGQTKVAMMVESMADWKGFSKVALMGILMVDNWVFEWEPIKAVKKVV